jgi:ATPase subunit of ABC transporter with duplicated ATPase domains
MRSLLERLRLYAQEAGRDPKVWALTYRRQLSYHKGKIVQSAAIQIQDIQKSYKQLTVLKGVTFTVERGSIFALLGSNGAGKTTLINILTTLLKQDGRLRSPRCSTASLAPGTYPMRRCL